MIKLEDRVQSGMDEKEHEMQLAKRLFEMEQRLVVVKEQLWYGWGLGWQRAAGCFWEAPLSHQRDASRSRCWAVCATFVMPQCRESGAGEGNGSASGSSLAGANANASGSGSGSCPVCSCSCSCSCGCG